MEILIFSVLTIAGLSIGYFLGTKKNGISKESYDELLRKESAAQEKINLLLSDISVKSNEIISLRDSNTNLNKDLAKLQALCPQLESTILDLKAEKNSLKIKTEELEKQLSSSNSQNSSLETEKKLIEQQLSTLKENIDESKKQTRIEFENLANQVLDAKTKSFNEHTEKSLGILLTPLKEKILSFEKTVDEKFNIESKERFSLKNEIEKLVTMNDKMAGEANALAKALRGDSKVQGDWGELVLERILEASGLVEGENYETQSSHQNHEGDRFRPDVIIKLPENKHMIIDSKVSLTAYDIYRSAESEQERDSALAEHIKSIEKHITELADKNYSKLNGINSPEFVLMFVPIEPAYITAMQRKPEIADNAWKKGVALVTSTTLLTTLKTIASIWRLEKQNKNAQEIAREGGLLYDKFVGFLDDFEKIGKIFDDGRKQFNDAKSKLKEGNGNVFRKIERLKELGASPSKKIKDEYLE